MNNRGPKVRARLRGRSSESHFGVQRETERGTFDCQRFRVPTFPRIIPGLVRTSCVHIITRKYRPFQTEIMTLNEEGDV